MITQPWSTSPSVTVTMLRIEKAVSLQVPVTGGGRPPSITTVPLR